MKHFTQPAGRGGFVPGELPATPRYFQVGLERSFWYFGLCWERLSFAGSSGTAALPLPGSPLELPGCCCLSRKSFLPFPGPCVGSGSCLGLSVQGQELEDGMVWVRRELKDHPKEMIPVPSTSGRSMSSPKLPCPYPGLWLWDFPAVPCAVHVSMCKVLHGCFWPLFETFPPGWC